MYGNLIHSPDSVYISPPGYATISPPGHFDVPIPPGSQTVYEIPQDSVMHLVPEGLGGVVVNTWA